MTTALIGLGADIRPDADQPFHAVGEKYLRAVSGPAGCLPLIIPALAAEIDLDALLSRLDGVLFTGSVTNVHPSRYAVPATTTHEPYDIGRDDLTLELIRRALVLGLPLLAICRGFQELNVALGGSLHAAVHELPGRLDHRAQGASWDEQYGPRHPLQFRPGSTFAELAGCEEITVNSLHRQAIDRLSPELDAQGTAPDGTIEAVVVTAAKGFALGVQWHPEFRATENEFSQRLFGAFGAAAKRYAQHRLQKYGFGTATE